ncbi:MAG: cation:proton antiporter [bacterium]
MNGFTELAIIISIAAFFGVIARKLKQPEILGYIVAGVVATIFIPSLKTGSQSIELFSKIGIAFLLFIVGLELDIREIKQLGKSVVLSSIGQVVITWFVVLGIALAMGFDLKTSSYIGIGLAFSSTIVVIKLLSQRGELETLHGKTSIVFLVMQDFIAIFVMILSSATGNISGGNIQNELMLMVFKGLLVVTVLILSTKFILPFILKIVNKERETLFIVIIAWALLFSAMVGSELIGFSIEIGALLAGIALADRYEHLQIETWMRPLRDFFLTLFFVELGLGLQLGAVDTIIIPVVVFTALVLIVKPLIIIFLLKSFNYGGRASFHTGISLSQISEFSLLLVAISLGQNSSILTIITLVGGLTMIISSYLFMYKDKLYDVLKKYIFGKSNYQKIERAEVEGHIVLLGCHRTGKNVLDYLIRHEEKLVVVDNNPLHVQQLKNMGIKALMGDLQDIDFLENLQLETASYVISTVPNMIINLAVLQEINKFTNKPITILLAKDEIEVSDLYHKGADYVVYPYILTGQKINMILKNKSNSHKHKVTVMKNILSSKSIG